MSSLNITSAAPLSSGHSIPRLGFGVYLSGDTKASVLEAFKAGYRHVDSAQMYENEAEVGEAVHASGLKREDVFITSKIESGNADTVQKAVAGVDESLNRMKLDFVDLFLIHDPLAGPEKRLEAWKGLIAARDAGKIKTIGVSNFGIQHLEQIKAAGLETPAVNQVEIHPFCQQRAIAKYCQENGIVVEAYCPILRGQLDTPVFVELAKKYNKDAAQVLLRWSLQKGFVPLPKSSTPSRIQSNTNLYDFELSDEDMAKLDALDKGPDGALSWNPIAAP